jgi:hypothetical protein
MPQYKLRDTVVFDGTTYPVDTVLDSESVPMNFESLVVWRWADEYHEPPAPVVDIVKSEPIHPIVESIISEPVEASLAIPAEPVPAPLPPADTHKRRRKQQ